MCCTKAAKKKSCFSGEIGLTQLKQLLYRLIMCPREFY